MRKILSYFHYSPSATKKQASQVVVLAELPYTLNSQIRSLMKQVVAAVEGKQKYQAQNAAQVLFRIIQN